MAASLDEASLGFFVDAPFSVSTNFYLLLGDNAYGYSSSNYDYDAYRILVDIGFHYGAVIGNTTPYGNNLSSISNLALYDKYGNLLITGLNYGSYSGLSFTATDTQYFLVANSNSAGYYGIRVVNNSILEENGIGEAIFLGAPIVAALDYTSDSDHFWFEAVAGVDYWLKVTTSIPDLFLKISSLDTGEVVDFASGGNGYYTFVATRTGAYSLSISSNYFYSTGDYSLLAGVVDRDGPSVAISTNYDQLGVGARATITFVLTEESVDFDIADVDVVGGILSNFAGSGAIYTSTFTPISNSSGTAVISVDSGRFSDAAGNFNKDGSDSNNRVSLNYNTLVDTTAPSISLSSSVLSLGAGQTATISFVLSEQSTDFTLSDISVSGGTLSHFTGSGDFYTAIFTPTANSSGTAVVSVASSRFSDAAGNFNVDGSDNNNRVSLSVPKTFEIAESYASSPYSGIYKFVTGEYAIDEAGLSLGDFSVAPVLLKTAKFQPYTFKAEPTAVVENTDGSFDIYMPSGAGWTQQKFKANGVVSGAPVTLSPLTLLAREKTINTDLDADGFVGDWVSKVYDAGSDTERGLYKTKAGAVVIDAPQLGTQALTQTPITLKLGTALYNPKFEPSSLLEYENGSYGVMSFNGVSWTEQRFSSKGVASGGPTKLNALQLVARELQFNDDIDADGFVGDWVVSVYDSGAANQRGLYKTKAGAVVIDAPLLDAQALTQTPITLKEGTALYNPKVAPSALLEYENGSYGVVTFNGVSWSEQLFSSKGVATGGAVKLSAQQLAAKERRFSDDINGDGILGDWVAQIYDAGSNAGRGLYKTMTGLLVVDAGQIGEREMTQMPITLRVGSALYNPKVAHSALLEYQNGSFGVVAFNGVDWTEQRFSAMGVASGTPVKLSMAQLLERERTFSEDVDGDGMLGDTIGSVIDNTSYISDSEQLLGLFQSSRGGAYYLDDLGQAVDDWLSSEALMLRANASKPWTPGKAQILGIAERGDGNLEVLLKSGTAYLAQTFNAETGVAMGAVQTLGAKNVAKREYYYDQDLNGTNGVELIGLEQPPANWGLI